MNKHKDCLCIEGCTVNPRCPVHNIKDNKYKHKSDMQVLMMAMAETMPDEISAGSMSQGGGTVAIPTYRKNDLKEELSWRGQQEDNE